MVVMRMGVTGSRAVSALLEEDAEFAERWRAHKLAQHRIQRLELEASEHWARTLVEQVAGSERDVITSRNQREMPADHFSPAAHQTSTAPRGSLPPFCSSTRSRSRASPPASVVVAHGPHARTHGRRRRIGVAHLARALIHRIRDAQPDLRLDPADDVVLALAGLGHAVGHGPFSHLFEDVIARNMGLQFDHEAMSHRLTRRMLDGIVTPAVADDVLAVMNGTSAAKRAAFDGPRGVLLDMVSNKRCGVDVDKLDYFLRDSLSCYGWPTVDARYARLFNAARAVPLPDGQWALGFDCKVMLDLRELWTLRSKLHVAVYQHRTVKWVT
jgi:hypothetical protein